MSKVISTLPFSGVGKIQPSILQQNSIQISTGNLSSNQFYTTELTTGKTSIITELYVSHPCIVECHSTSNYDDINPYNFVASIDHLEDTGKVVFDDGTFTFRERYSIIANNETPQKNKTYWRIKNTNVIAISITLNIKYSLILN